METTIAGRTIEFGLDDNGTFKARWNGEQYEHKTLAGLKAMIERQMKKKPISIKVFRAFRDHFSERLEMIEGIVVGRHSGNGNFLVKWKDGERYGQVEQHRRYNLLRGDIDLKKIRALHVAARRAAQAYEEYRAKFDFQLDPELLEDTGE